MECNFFLGSCDLDAGYGEIDIDVQINYLEVSVVDNRVTSMQSEFAHSSSRGSYLPSL